MDILDKLFNMTIPSFDEYLYIDISDIEVDYQKPQQYHEDSISNAPLIVTRYKVLM